MKTRRTLTFIWGLILIVVCSIACGIHVHEIRANVDGDWFDNFLFVFSIIGAISGGDRINDAINEK